MSAVKVPRGTARALRRSSAAPSLRMASFAGLAAGGGGCIQLDDMRRRRDEARELCEEGYSRTQALLMVGLADPYEPND